jgi:hypothetical protein
MSRPTTRIPMSPSRSRWLSKIRPLSRASGKARTTDGRLPRVTYLPGAAWAIATGQGVGAPGRIGRARSFSFAGLVSPGTICESSAARQTIGQPCGAQPCLVGQAPQHRDIRRLEAPRPARRRSRCIGLRNTPRAPSPRRRLPHDEHPTTPNRRRHAPLLGGPLGGRRVPTQLHGTYASLLRLTPTRGGPQLGGWAPRRCCRSVRRGSRR